MQKKKRGGCEKEGRVCEREERVCGRVCKRGDVKGNVRERGMERKRRGEGVRKGCVRERGEGVREG